MSRGGRGNIIRALEELDKNDIYSLILFALYRLKDNSKYSTLSELIYVLDNENFIKFINYYGGKTITVPTIKDLTNILQALLAFEEMNNTDKSLDDILRDLSLTEKDKKEMIRTINLIEQIVGEYDFKR